MMFEQGPTRSTLKGGEAVYQGVIDSSVRAVASNDVPGRHNGFPTKFPLCLTVSLLSIKSPM